MATNKKTPETQAYFRQRYYDRMEEAYRLLGGKCSKCGSVESLEFDHTIREGKLYEVSRAASGFSYSRFIEEVKKCQLLCHKCHLEKTRQDLGWHDGSELITIVCAYCGTEQTKTYKEIGNKLRCGQTKFYCDRSCMGKDMWRSFGYKRVLPFDKAPCGTHSKYTRGCRCSRCTGAHRIYQNEYLKKKVTS